MIDLTDVTHYQLVDAYLTAKSQDFDDAPKAYVFGRYHTILINVLTTNAKAPHLLSEQDKKNVPTYLKLCEDLGIDVNIFGMDENELADTMELHYYRVFHES